MGIYNLFSFPDLHTPFLPISLPLISLVASVDVKYHVYLLAPKISVCGNQQLRNVDLVKQSSLLCSTLHASTTLLAYTPRFRVFQQDGSRFFETVRGLQ